MLLFKRHPKQPSKINLLFDALKLRIDFETKLKQYFLVFLLIIVSLIGSSFFNYQNAFEAQHELIAWRYQDLVDLELIETLVDKQINEYFSFLSTSDPNISTSAIKTQATIQKVVSEIVIRNSSDNSKTEIFEMINTSEKIAKLVTEGIHQKVEAKEVESTNRNFKQELNFQRNSFVEKLGGVITSKRQLLNDMKLKSIQNHKYNLIFQAETALLVLLFWLGLYLLLATAISKKRNAELFIQNTLDVSPIILFLYDLTTKKIVYVSQQVENILGFSFEKSQDFVWSPSQCVHPDDVQMVTDFLGKIAQSKIKTISNLIFRSQHKNGGYRYLEVRCSEYSRNSKKNIDKIVGTATDVSVIKNKELELENTLRHLDEKKKDLEQSNLQLIQFASVAAHDLRSPLKSILGWTELLEEQLPFPRTLSVTKAINYILKNSRKADSLIEDILQIAKINISPHQSDAINLNTLLVEICEVLKSEIELTKSQIILNSLPTIVGSSSAIESVFSNLIRNALTYRKPLENPVIEVSCVEEGDFYKFSIVDNGIGIPKKYFSKIFEMFRRLHQESEYTGTGIGLAYCKKVVELSGGKIWVESEVDVGSRFYFTHPKQRRTLA